MKPGGRRIRAESLPCGLALLVDLAGIGGCQEPAPPRSNIVFILADDLG